MIPVLIVAVCILINGMLAGYEMAFVSVSRRRLRRAAEAGDGPAAMLLRLRAEPERTLSVIQVGITLVGAVAAAVGGGQAAESLRPWLRARFDISAALAQGIAIGAVVVPISYLSVVLGELVPKTIAMRFAMRFARLGLPAIRVLDTVLAPVVGILSMSTRGILKLIPGAHARQPAAEQKAIELEPLTPMHRQYLLNFADAGNRRIEYIMVSPTEVDAVSETDGVERVYDLVLASGHTRLPVLRGGDVVGILHTKEFVAFRDAGRGDWQQIVRLPLEVRRGDLAVHVMRWMQQQRSHMAIVRDEARKWIGMVTLEDILEEVVGELYDEDDDGRVDRLIAISRPLHRSRFFRRDGRR